jgi:hypothetical protein
MKKDECKKNCWDEVSMLTEEEGDDGASVSLQVESVTLEQNGRNERACHFHPRSENNYYARHDMHRIEQLGYNNHNTISPIVLFVVLQWTSAAETSLWRYDRQQPAKRSRCMYPIQALSRYVITDTHSYMQHKIIEQS